MSTSAAEHQKSKGQGNPSKSYNNRFPNGPKDHHGGEREEVDSWRNQQQQPQPHHQGYSNAMGAGGDPYGMQYYGGFQYQGGPAFGVPEGGPWSNGGDMAFVGGGYAAGMHEAGPPSGHYNNMEAGMFGGGNAGGFGNFGGQQPGFGYGYGNGDYNTWGQPRKPYDDYYRSRDGMYGEDRGMKMVDGMSGLSLGDKEHSIKDLKEMMSGGGGGGSKKTTWASIASQPAKPQSLMKKKTALGGMPPPPIMLGAWEKNGSVAKAPIAAPVQAPHPPAWERMERVPKMPPPPPLGAHHAPPNSMPPPMHVQGMPRGGGYPHPQGGQMGYNMPPPQPHPHPPPPLVQHQQPPHQAVNNSNHLPPPVAAVATGKTSPSGPQYPDEAKMKSDYNPSHFDLQAEGARFFVIKSYSEDDIHRSIKYEIWCSTEHGNKRLDQAWRERDGKGPIYLFFSVNSSGHFCGMAQMMSNVDYESSSSVWCQDKWKGQFKVKWVYVKDVPNSSLRHIRLENNENKSVTNSRDTQEVPFEKGKQVLKILHSFQHTTSIFDDFIHYEKRQEEEDQRRTAASPPPSNNNHHHDRGDRNDRGHGHRGGGSQSNHYAQYRDNNRDNPRGGDRDGGHDRGHYQGQGRGGGMRGMDRDHYGGGGGGRDNGRGFDRGGDSRDFYQRDGRDHRGGGGGGRGGSSGGGRPPRIN